MERHRQRPALAHLARGIEIGGIGGIALARQRQVHGRLGQGDEAFGHAGEFHGLLAGHGQGQGRRVGKAHILGCGQDEAAADEARVLPAFEQAGEVVEGRVHIAAADGLDERRGEFVVAVAVLVMADQHFRQGRAHGFRVALFLRQGGHIFHQIEQGAGIAVGRACQKVEDILAQGERERERAAPRKIPQFVAAQGPQAQHMQPGKQLARDAERGIFRGGSQQGKLAGFHQWQEKILLGLGKAVQFVKNEDLHPGKGAAQVLESGLGRGEAQVFFAR